jgi:RNA polymerase sigma-70 factor (ECF subfamily)
MIDAATFEPHRRYLFGLAYRMLGSAHDAEDVVQDAWLRSRGAPADVRSVRAYLRTVVTRLCLDRLKAARATREEYVGPWLPEPLLTDEITPDLSLERSESVTLAFLTVLESLGPQERAVFLLREVFDVDYDGIADTLGLTPANCRQIFHRAKARIGTATPRRDGPRPRERAVVEAFMQALGAADAARATSLLAPDVRWVSDGGGKASAAGVPLAGRERVGRLLDGLCRTAQRLGLAARARLTQATVNAEPAILLWLDDRLETLFVLSVGEEGIAAVFAQRNPDKLRRVEAEARRYS